MNIKKFEKIFVMLSFIVVAFFTAELVLTLVNIKVANDTLEFIQYICFLAGLLALVGIGVIMWVNLKNFTFEFWKEVLLPKKPYHEQIKDKSDDELKEKYYKHEFRAMKTTAILEICSGAIGIVAVIWLLTTI